MKKLLWSLIIGSTLLVVFLYAQRKRRSAGAAAAKRKREGVIKDLSSQEMKRRWQARRQRGHVVPPSVQTSPVSTEIKSEKKKDMCPGGVCPIVKALQKKGRI